VDARISHTVFRSDLYYSTRQRENWDETRAGAAFTLGHRFTNEISARVTVRGEDVFIHAIDNPFIARPEIIVAEGHHTLTSVGLAARYDTTDNRILPSRGMVVDAAYEYAGALGGKYDYPQVLRSAGKLLSDD